MITSKLLSLRNKKHNFEASIFALTLPATCLFNVIIIAYCAFIADLPMDYTPIQLAWLFLLTCTIVILVETLFQNMVTKPLSNNICYWEAKKDDPSYSFSERTELLKTLGRFPLKNAMAIGIIFISTGTLYSFAAHVLMNVDLHISVFYFHLYISLSIFYILMMIFLIEKKCSLIATKIVSHGVELKEKKFFGLSQNANFILYIAIPIVGIALISFHAVIYSLTPKTIHVFTGNITSRNLSTLENMGLAVKSNLTKNESMLFYLKLSISNVIFTFILISIYYARTLNSTKLMQDSLILLRNKKINPNNLFKIDMFTEESYTMYLINRTILIFDSIIRNNTKTNREIDAASGKLAMISQQTKENVIKQSMNIEEILATMQSVDNLSKKIESNFDEVITVAYKTLERVDLTSRDLKENLDKIQEITTTNRITIDHLKELYDMTNGIQDVINAIDKVAEQTKTVAFNAELEANNINIEGVDFTNVAEEIRRLSNNIMDLTKKIHAQIIDVTNTSEDLIATGNYCMKKTEEGNDICVQIGYEFEKIKQCSRETSSNSANIKESLHEQTNAFHQIVETLSQISNSIKNFGKSSTTIAETIEKLRENSSHILALNNKYNNNENENENENTQEGTAI